MPNLVHTQVIYYLAIFGSISFLFLIFELIRKKYLKEEYSLLWLLFTTIIFILSVWWNQLNTLSFLIGIAYPPVTLLLCLVIALYLIVIHYSTVLSRLSERNKQLSQELALLKHEVEEIKKRVKIEEVN